MPLSEPRDQITSLQAGIGTAVHDTTATAASKTFNANFAHMATCILYRGACARGALGREAYRKMRCQG